MASPHYHFSAFGTLNPCFSHSAFSRCLGKQFSTFVCVSFFHKEYSTSILPCRRTLYWLFTQAPRKTLPSQRSLHSTCRSPGTNEQYVWKFFFFKAREKGEKMIQWRSFWAGKGMEWRGKPCRYLGWESSRQGEAKAWGDTPGKSRDSCWGQWWKEGTEEDRADLRRRWAELRRRQAARWRASGFYSSWKQSHYRVPWRELTWRDSHLEMVTLNAGLEILLCKQRDQSESPCHNPGERCGGSGWWEWNDDKGSDSAKCGRKSWQNVLMDWTWDTTPFLWTPPKKEIKEQLKKTKQNKTTHSLWQIIQRFSTSAEAIVKTHPSSTKICRRGRLVSSSEEFSSGHFKTLRRSHLSERAK